MNALELALQRKKELKEQGITPERLTPYQHAERDPKSRLKAIKAHCLDCSGDDMKVARECDMVKCWLYNVNPWRQ